MKNNSDTPFTILPTDRIAQFIFEKAASPCIEVVKELPPTKRKDGGFGSTNSTNRRTTHSTFRLDDKYILYINNSNPFRPVAQRVLAPVCRTATTKETMLSTNNTIDTTQNNIEYTDITTHQLENNSPILLEVLHQKIQPIPTSVPSSPQEEMNQPTPSPNEAVSTTIPAHLTMSQDALHQAVGFYNTHNLLKHIQNIGQKTVRIQQLPKLDTIDPGEVASLQSQRRQTSPSSLPNKYSDIWHMDIGHGPCTAIGGARYTLLLVDKSTRFKFV